MKCPDCGVRVEAVPWARRGSRFTHDFEDVVAHLAQQMAKAPIARLMRIAWDTVGAIVERVIAERLDPRRLDGLRLVGVDEVSYRRRHRYLTVVADHESGRIVWVRKSRNSATLQAFFDQLGTRKATIRAVSIDMSGDYQRAIRHAVPQAEIAFDPFHVVRVGADAVDQVRRDEWNAHERSHTAAGRWVKHTRWALLKAPDRQSLQQLGTLGEVYTRNRRLYRAFLLYHRLRLLYALEDPPSRRRISTPGWPGRPDRSSRRSSRPRAPCAATAPASSPPSASGCPTGAWRASTAACGSSATAASAFTPPPR